MISLTSIASRLRSFFAFFIFLVLIIFFLLTLAFPKISYSSKTYYVKAGVFPTNDNVQDILKSLVKNGIACDLQESAHLYKMHYDEFSRKSDTDATKKKLNLLGSNNNLIILNTSQIPEPSQEKVIKPIDTKDVEITENETIQSEMPLERKDTTVIPKIIVDPTEVTSRRHSRYSLSASDEPFTGPGNRGVTGLMEIPTARVMREESYRFGITMVHPYWYYYIGATPLEGLEIFGRVTRVEGVSAGLGKGYGDFKDRALELKYQFIPEGKYMPAIAIGIMDPQGTTRYASQYIVASKQIYPFDFTIGMGNGRFGKKPLPFKENAGFKIELLQNPKEWWRSKNFFWGIQFAPSEKYAFMIEYSPIQYNKQTPDPAQRKYFKEPVPSKYNFGFRWRPLKWTEFDLSYQRGNTIGAQLSLNFDIGKPMLPIIDLPYRERLEDRLLPFHKRIGNALLNSGFSDIGITVLGDEIWIDLENDKYFYSTKALGVIMETIMPFIPESINRVNITLKKIGIPIFIFKTTREDITDLHNKNLSLNEFWQVSKIDTGITNLPPDQVYIGRHSLTYGIKPSFETSFEKAEKFFQYRIGIEGWADYRLWNGASLDAGIATYPVNTITGMEPLSRPVRSDLLNYVDKTASLDRLMFNQIHKLTSDIYGRIGVGLLEIEYGGVDAEVASPLFDGRLLIGLSGSVVKKRESGNPFKFKKDDWKDFYTTAFLNARLNIPEYEVSIDTKSGRFLAGDIGTRITVSKFIRGVTISAWYSFTNTSIFHDDENRGYHDKGILISIPLRLFTGKDSMTRYFYVISPWMRDVGQDIYHYREIFDFLGRDTKIYLDKDKRMMVY
jgi:hypothetical protein